MEDELKSTPESFVISPGDIVEVFISGMWSWRKVVNILKESELYQNVTCEVTYLEFADGGKHRYSPGSVRKIT